MQALVGRQDMRWLLLLLATSLLSLLLLHMVLGDSLLLLLLGHMDHVLLLGLLLLDHGNLLLRRHRVADHHLSLWS